MTRDPFIPLEDSVELITESANAKIAILLVAEKQHELFSWEAVLRPLGENVLRAGSVGEALAILSNQEVAVVLIDATMPGGDSLEIARKVRTHLKGGGLPVIFLSPQDASEADRLKAYEAGAVDYLCFPIAPEILQAKVSSFATLYRQAHELKRLNQHLRQHLAARRTGPTESNIALRGIRASNEVNEITEQVAERVEAGQEAGRPILYEFRPKTGEVVRDRTVQSLLGYSVEEIEATPAGWWALIHPEDLSAVQTAFNGALESGTEFEYEYRVRHKNGHTVHLSDRARIVRDEKSRVERVVGTIVDVAERKEMNGRLRESEQKFRVALQHTPILVYTTDRELRYRSIFNIPSQSESFYVIGKRDDEILPLETCGDLVQFKSEVLSRGAGDSREIKVSFGNRVEYWDVNAEPYRDEKGNIQGLVVAAMDITSRKQAEKQLAVQRRLYQSVTDNATTALFIMDENQHCVFMNPAAEILTGYTFAETQGRALHDVIHHTHPDGTPYPLSECPIDQAFPSRNQMRGEEVFVHKHGHFYDVAFAASPLRDESGETVGTVIEVQDITERKLAEEKLRNSEAFSRTVLENSPDCVKILDRFGRLEFMNANGLCLMEIDDFAPLRRTFWPELWSDDAKQIVKGSIKKAQDGQLAHFQAACPTAKGTPKWWDVIVSPVPDAEGRVSRLISVSRDITTQKRRELHLAFTADLQAAFAPLASDREIVALASRKIREYLGLSRCLFVEIDEAQQTATVFHAEGGTDDHDLSGTYRLEDFHTVAERVALGAGQTIVIGDVHDGERTPEAAARFASLGIGALMTASYVSDGRWRFALSAQTDQPREWLTDERELFNELASKIYIRLERARAEQALTRERERLTVALLAGGLGVYEWKMGEHAIWWSPETYPLFGVDASTFSPTIESFGNLVHPDDREELWRKSDESLARGERFEHEYRIIRPDGQIRWIYNRSKISQDDGRTQITGVAADITERRRAEEALRKSELLENVIKSQEAERHRIARDLHDHLGQRVTGLRLALAELAQASLRSEDMIEKVEQVQQNARLLDRDVSLLAFELRANVVVERGLIGALDSFVSEWSLNYGIPAEFHVINPSVRKRLPDDVETHLYRITQEALNNVLKYAKAGCVNVILEIRDDEVRLIIEDDGVGFDLGSSVHGKKLSGRGSGLKGMEERVALLAGRLQIESAPGTGAVIFVNAPIGHHQHEDTQQYPDGDPVPCNA